MLESDVARLAEEAEKLEVRLAEVKRQLLQVLLCVTREVSAGPQQTFSTEGGDDASALKTPR